MALTAPRGYSRNREIVQQDIESNRVITEKVLALALQTADSLFDHGDLRPFIDILCRLHNYNYFNILLIQCQYRDATCLTSQQVWQALMGSTHKQAIKDQYAGRPIKLVTSLPCLNPSYVEFICLNVYDIKQTNITGFKPDSGIYRKGEEHYTLLYRSLRMALSDQYNTSIVYKGEWIALSEYTIPGYRDGKQIFCNPNLPKEELIQFLARNMLELSEPEKVIGKRYLELFLHISQYCLLKIWGITEAHLLFLYQDHDLVRSIPQDLRRNFLDLLQKRVRAVEEIVYSTYEKLLPERKEEPSPISLPLEMWETD